MANPIFNDRTIERIGSSAEPMTVSGTIGKSLILTVMAMVAAYFGWVYASVIGPLIIVFVIAALVAVLVASFKPTTAPIAAPLYAILEGVAIGAISAMYNAQTNGIVLQALMLTFGILFLMLVIYQSRIITVTAKFRSVIVMATFGVMALYLVTWIASFFGANVSFMYDSGALGIGINVVIAVIASLNFLLDFDSIERGAAAHAPKYMEWLAGMGLLITIIWLYLEILRLLARLNRR